MKAFVFGFMGGRSSTSPVPAPSGLFYSFVTLSLLQATSPMILLFSLHQAAHVVSLLGFILSRNLPLPIFPYPAPALELLVKSALKGSIVPVYAYI